jgi:hypothetical protein
MNNKDKALRWPYGIAISIVLVIGLCIGTIIISFERPVEPSDRYMRGYHDTDANINAIIAKEIEFKKHYTIEYLSDQIAMDNTVLKYKISNVDGTPVDNANIRVIVTRPHNHKHNQELNSSNVSEGIYTFESITLPEAGRWNIMAHVQVGELERYYNLKADTRYESTFEY